MSFRMKKDKETTTDFEGRQKELRNQVTEQLRCLDTKVEWENTLLTELQDYYTKRAQIEERYSNDLRKLYNVHVEKLKSAERVYKMRGASEYGLFSYYNIVLGVNQNISATHQTVANVFHNKIAPRFSDIKETSKNLQVRCKDIIIHCHEEVMKNVKKLHDSVKQYHNYRGIAENAANKLELARDEIVKKGEKINESRRKTLEKAVEKKQTKYDEAKYKALESRNNYIIQLEVTNTVVHRYSVEEVNGVLDCLSWGYHSSLVKACMQHLKCEEILKERHDIYAQSLYKTADNQINVKIDKTNFINSNKHVFTEFKKFVFDAHKDDPIKTVCANNKKVFDTLEIRQNQLQTRMKELQLQSDNLWKQMETIETNWVNLFNARDYEVRYLFYKKNTQRKDGKESLVENDVNKLLQSSDKGDNPVFDNVEETRDRRKEIADHADKYFGLYKDWVTASNFFYRQRAMFVSIGKALGTESGNRLPELPCKPKKKSITKATENHLTGAKHKVFGGDLSKASEIPLLILSCIRVINKFGLHHQGIFRIPGSASDVKNFKDKFEEGFDPFSEVSDARDLNSAAGVLKSYLRELSEPLLPSTFFDEFVECARCASKDDSVSKLKEILQNINPNVYRVLRYIFTFLNHLTYFSDENLMDSYNLSVCLGPSFLPVPPNRDPVVYQAPINDLVKTMIDMDSEIFTRNEVSGPFYEKVCMDFDEHDEDTQSVVDVDEHLNVEHLNESEFYQATAKYDFIARTPRELSFAKGDVLTIFARTTTDWLTGCNSENKQGLIPDNYVTPIENTPASSTLGSSASLNELPGKKLDIEGEEDMGAEVVAAPVEESATVKASSAPKAVFQQTLPTLKENSQSDHTDFINSDESSLKHQRSDEDEKEMKNIDQALKEVIAGLESFGADDSESHYADPQTLFCSKMFLPGARHTPDLLLDMPASRGLSSDTDVTVADQFAEEGHETLKRQAEPKSAFRPALTRGKLVQGAKLTLSPQLSPSSDSSNKSSPALSPKNSSDSTSSKKTDDESKKPEVASKPKPMPKPKQPNS